MFQFYRSKPLFSSFFLQFLLNFVRVQNNSWKCSAWWLSFLRGGRNSPTIIYVLVKVLVSEVPLETVHSSEIYQTSLYHRGSFPRVYRLWRTFFITKFKRYKRIWRHFSLLSSEQGMDVLVQLGLLTDMQFSCPTGLTGSYARGKTFDIMSKCT